MKFEFVKDVEDPVMSYGGVMVWTGDVVELEGWFAEKAQKNPNFRLLEASEVPKEQPKRRGRPPKVKDGN